MRLMSIVCAGAVAATAIALTPDAFAQRRGQGGGILVLNYQRVIQESALGRDMGAKLQQVGAQLSAEAQTLTPERQSIEQEAQRLQGSLRNQTPQQLSANPQVQALAQRQQQLNARAQGLQGDLECSQLIALRDVRNQIMPIVRAVMEQRRAVAVFDASAALEVSSDSDITTTVIQQLDQNAATRTANAARHAVAECAAQQQAPAQ